MAMGMEVDERFHPLVEGTSAAIFVFDAKKILYINPACKRLTGRSARELLGRPFLNLIHPQFRSRYESPAAMSGGTHDQVKIVTKGGEARWTELWLQPILYRGVTATLATAVDVNQLKVSDLARREAEVQLKLVQRAGRTVSWDWRVSTDELVIYGLPKDLIVHGAPVLTTTGKAFFEQIHPDDLVNLKQAVRSSLQDREPLFLEIGLRGPEGDNHWLVLRGQVVADRAGHSEHLVGVATDVTDRRRAEMVLIQEQQHTLAMLVSISDGVIRTDLEGRIQDLSGPAEDIVGSTLEEIKGRKLGEVLTFLDPNSSAVLADPVTESLQSDQPLSQPQTSLLQRDDGDDLPIRFHTVVLRDKGASPTGVVLVVKDLAEEKQVERGMVYLATHDPLTDLVNRTEFERQLGQVIASANKMRRQDSLLYMDLDGFTRLNETFGHPAGDKMLKQFASFLKCRFRETDTLGRLGGDKFGVLLESCQPWQARELVEKLYKDLRSFRFEWDESSLPVSLSCGMAAIGPEDGEVDKVLGAAEAACYLAKQKGGNRFYEYEPSEVAATERHTQLEILHQIQDALRDGSFELHAQLIQPVRAPESDPTMFEILVRLEDRSGKLLLPGHFIPVAERHRIVSAIDRWVLTQTLESVAGASSDSGGNSEIFAVNISGQSLADDRFLEFVLHELSYRGVEPGRVCFEITETATVANFDRAQRFISVLKERGCRFVLDDFGSGLSSFAYLRNFPVDFIKIDGQFVQGMTKDPTQKALVESINHVGHVMQIKTIAEAIEDDATLEAVRLMDVDYAQGHGIAMPVPLAQILELGQSKTSATATG